MLAPLAKDADLRVRRIAVWALGNIETSTPVPVLAAAVRDADRDVRLTALWALGEIEADTGVDAASAALKDRDAEVRRMAAWALGAIESSRAVSSLTPLLRDAESGVRATPAWALGQASPDCYNNGDGVDVVEAVGKIYVCNYNGNDVLVYNSPPDNQNPDPLFALGIEDYNLNSLDSIGYIQNPSFSTDGTRLIVTSDFDQRIYIYNQLPAISGQLPDQVISTRDYDLAAWDNTWFEQRFVAVGRNRICIWENATDLSGFPSQTFQNNIGSASFSDLKGVALDEHYLYVADRNGKLFIWDGIPANNTDLPLSRN